MVFQRVSMTLAEDEDCAFFEILPLGAVAMQRGHRRCTTNGDIARSFQGGGRGAEPGGTRGVAKKDKRLAGTACHEPPATAGAPF